MADPGEGEAGDNAQREKVSSLPKPDTGGRGPPASNSGVSISGYAWKQGGRFKTWKWRFFVLLPGELVVRYYKSATETTDPLGAIDLRGTTISHDKSNRRPCVFTIAHEERRTYLIQPESLDQMEQWIFTLQFAKFEAQRDLVARLQKYFAATRAGEDAVSPSEEEIATLSDLDVSMTAEEALKLACGIDFTCFDVLIFEDGSPLADKFTSFHRIPRDVPHVAGSEYVKVFRFSDMVARVNGTNYIIGEIKKKKRKKRNNNGGGGGSSGAAPTATPSTAGPGRSDTSPLPTDNIKPAPAFRLTTSSKRRESAPVTLSDMSSVGPPVASDPEDSDDDNDDAPLYLDTYAGMDPLLETFNRARRENESDDGDESDDDPAPPPQPDGDGGLVLPAGDPTGDALPPQRRTLEVETLEPMRLGVEEVSMVPSPCGSMVLTGSIASTRIASNGSSLSGDLGSVDLLPEGWVRVMEDAGTCYYFNTSTRETTRQQPTGGPGIKMVPAATLKQGDKIKATSTVDQSDLPPNWRRVKDANKDRFYYYNRKTKETSWKKPNPDGTLP